jgi:F420-dependent oxidoreductase-like protein
MLRWIRTGSKEGSMQELRFGTFVPQGWRMDLAGISDPVEKYRKMRRCAAEAEAAGYDSLWLYDHFHTVPTPQTEATLECWASMAALSRDTSRIRLGQMVTCNGYRPPALLAKMASCVDVFSEGRLIVGIGAGWYQHEYEAYGYEFPETPERLRMLREALQVLKAMWTQERAEFEGRYYHLRGAINEPKPVQKPHPPLWIGGGGERVTLKLVAQYGDACNFGGDPATLRHKLEVLRAHCEAAGTDYGRIVKSTEIHAIVGDDAEVAAVVEETARRTMQEPEAVRAEFEPFVGRPEQVAEAIQAAVDVGIEYFIVFQPNLADEGVIRRFAEDVIPRLRQAATALG